MPLLEFSQFGANFGFSLAFRCRDAAFGIFSIWRELWIFISSVDQCVGGKNSMGMCVYSPFKLQTANNNLQTKLQLQTKQLQTKQTKQPANQTNQTTCKPNRRLKPCGFCVSQIVRWTLHLHGLALVGPGSFCQRFGEAGQHGRFGQRCVF